MVETVNISLDNIVEAAKRLSGVADITALQLNANLSEQYQCNILLKREDLQVVRSYKIRGAFNKMSSLSKEILNKGVVCASAGNHAQGFAFACQKLGVYGKIYMPSVTPQQKVTKVKKFGKDWVEIVLVGDTFDDAFQEAITYSEASGKAFIHPFNDPKIIEGQGTVALEILNQYPHEIDYLIAPIGGGGLISGIAIAAKAINPKIKIHIKILEKVDLAGRAGYFDSTGAFKDMWPHLFSLLTLTLETANLSTILSSLEDLDNVKIEQVFLGQYATYCDEAGLEDSTTETFFKIKLNIDEAEIIMESGKNLPTKITEIELTVEKNQNETKKMIWNIYPQQTLTLLNEQSTESFDNFDKQINRQTKFLADLSNSRLDQTNLFELLLNNEKQHFVTPEKISQSWKIWQKIVNFIATNQIKIQVYQDQTMPKTD
jgi:hypothetical protein